MQKRAIHPALLAAGCLLLILRAAAPAPAQVELPIGPINLLEAQREGTLQVSVRGAGEDRVKLTVTNPNPERLRVVLPPGLVASARTGQFQSMGLGGLGSPAGNGRFGGTVAVRGPQSANAGFRSISIEADTDILDVEAGATVSLDLAAVCLDYGVPEPTARVEMDLVDISEVRADPIAQSALRTLAAHGTSHGIAQAVMWHLASDVDAAQLARIASQSDQFNVHEVASALRIARVLRAEGSAHGLGRETFDQGRILVRLDGADADVVTRLKQDLTGARILGLPTVVVEDLPRDVIGPVLALDVTLGVGRAGQARAGVTLRTNDASNRWIGLGRTDATPIGDISDLDAKGLAQAITRAVSARFVTVEARPLGDGARVTINNRLPLTLRGLDITRVNGQREVVQLRGIGVGPAQTVDLDVPAYANISAEAMLSGF